MLFQIDTSAKRATRIPATSYSSLGLMERYDIQEWVLDKPELLGEELMVIATEYDGFDRTSERLDILALDKNGVLVVVELKRNAIGTAAELQALRYAAYCSTWTLEDVIAERARHRMARGETDVTAELVRAELEEFAPNIVDGIGSKPRIILAAEDFSPGITATVLWLRTFEVDVSCVQLIPYRLETAVLLNTSVLIPLPEALQYVVQKERKEAVEAKEARGPAFSPDEIIACLPTDVRMLVSDLRAWLLGRADTVEKAWSGGWLGYRAASDRAWITWITPHRDGTFVGLPPEAAAGSRLHVKTRRKDSWREARLASTEDLVEIKRLLASNYGVRYVTLSKATI